MIGKGFGERSAWLKMAAGNGQEKGTKKGTEDFICLAVAALGLIGGLTKSALDQSRQGCN